uniref:Secreted protein n=1 Tax=Arundo donax TaxID=35708 RepID=A0A0A9D7E9_ARUDO
MMVFLASDAASVFLAAMMTWAPLRAKTLEVSRPMPLAPPERCQNNCFHKTSTVATVACRPSSDLTQASPGIGRGSEGFLAGLTNGSFLRGCG